MDYESNQSLLPPYSNNPAAGHAIGTPLQSFTEITNKTRFLGSNR